MCQIRQMCSRWNTYQSNAGVNHIVPLDSGATLLKEPDLGNTTAAGWQLDIHTPQLQIPACTWDVRGKGDQDFHA